MYRIPLFAGVVGSLIMVGIVVWLIDGVTEQLIITLG